MRRILALAAVPLLLVLASCSSTGATSTTDTTVESFALTVFAVDTVKGPFDKLVAEFKRVHPEVSVAVTYGTSDDLFAKVRTGDRPGMLVDSTTGIDRYEQYKLAATVTTFIGSDEVQVFVAKGNPKGINSLQVFAPGATAKGGMCAKELRCGAAGRSAIKAAGLQYQPAVTAKTADELVAKLTSGEIDAALAFRSDLPNPDLFDVAPLPQRLGGVKYSTVRLRSNYGVDLFLQFLRSPAGQAASSRSGFVGNAPQAGASTTTPPG